MSLPIPGPRSPTSYSSKTQLDGRPRLRGPPCCAPEASFFTRCRARRPPLISSRALVASPPDSVPASPRFDRAIAGCGGSLGLGTPAASSVRELVAARVRLRRRAYAYVADVAALHAEFRAAWKRAGRAQLQARVLEETPGHPDVGGARWRAKRRQDGRLERGAIRWGRVVAGLALAGAPAARRDRMFAEALAHNYLEALRTLTALRAAAWRAAARLPRRPRARSTTRSTRSAATRRAARDENIQYRIFLRRNGVLIAHHVRRRAQLRLRPTAPRSSVDFLKLREAGLTGAIAPPGPAQHRFSGGIIPRVLVPFFRRESASGVAARSPALRRDRSFAKRLSHAPSRHHLAHEHSILRRRCGSAQRQRARRFDRGPSPCLK